VESYFIITKVSLLLLIKLSEKNFFTIPMEKRNADVALKVVDQEGEEDELSSDLVISVKQMVLFPDQVGLTSKAFHTGEAFHYYQGDPKPSAFLEDIDNFQGYETINDFIIMRMTDSEGVPRGVVQLFNFRSGLRERDVERLKALEVFLGSQLRNVGDYTSCLITMIGIKAMLSDCFERLGESDAGVQQVLFELNSLGTPLDTVKRMIERSMLKQPNHDLLI